MERSDMKSSLKSAGEPGARRCSDAKQVQAKAMDTQGLVSTPLDAGLPYCVDIATRRGRHVRRDYFAVPALSWDKSYILGFQVAAEALKWARHATAAGDGHHHPPPAGVLGHMTEAAAAILHDPRNPDHRGRKGAALAFMSVMSRLLHGAAIFINWEQEIEASRRGASQLVAWSSKRASERARRGHATRAAKREAAEARP